MDEVGFLLYLGVKLGAYIGWCYPGARLHGHRDRLLLRSLVYGILRAAMGVILGFLAIAWLASGVYGWTENEGLSYVAAYVPVRWVEWSLMAILMDQEHRTASNFWIGWGAGTRLWRLGGMAISCLADLPMIIAAGHVPIGRFFVC